MLTATASRTRSRTHPTVAAPRRRGMLTASTSIHARWGGERALSTRAGWGMSIDYPLRGSYIPPRNVPRRARIVQGRRSPPPQTGMDDLPRLRGLVGDHAGVAAPNIVSGLALGSPDCRFGGG